MPDREDWHPADIAAALKKKGISLAGLAIANGYHPTATGKALKRSWPALEHIIAKALGVEPAEIWPSRYAECVRPGRRSGKRLVSADQPTSTGSGVDSGSGGAVLIYEDDLTCAQGFAAVLRSAGYSVQIAGHFQPALAALETEMPIDLLLADIVMPDGVNGIALARMARLRRPALRVIYVTGYSLGGFERDIDVRPLHKPVSDELLLTEVNRVLQG